jgi:predicted transposase/invertase (TIGR01784 family)
MQKIRFSPADDIIDICQDSVFKAIFTRDSVESQGALSRLVSAIIEKEVEVLAVIANEPPVSGMGDRQTRYDIRARFTSGELANIEMTMFPRSCELLRLEYHESRLHSSQGIRGKKKKYGDLQHTYQISFLANRIMFADNDIMHHFTYYDREKEVSLDGRTHIIVVELKKTEKLPEKPVQRMSAQERWAIFFRYCSDPRKRDVINSLLDEEEGIAMAGEVLFTVSKDEKERAWLESRLKYELDLQSEKASAQQEGRSEGLVEGRTEGREAAKLEDARSMKKWGDSAEKIAAITGLPAETINGL